MWFFSVLIFTKYNLITASRKIRPYGHHTDLCCKGTEPDPDEGSVSGETLKDIALVVNFSSIQLIEQCHHHKGVEYSCKVLRWSRMQAHITSTVNIK